MVDSLVGGGAERSVLEIAGGLACRGWSVDLITLHPPIVYEPPKGVRHTQLATSPRCKDSVLAERLKQVHLDLCAKHGEPALVLVNLIRSCRVVRRIHFNETPVYHVVRNPLATQIQHTRTWAVGWYRRWQLRNLFNGQRIIGISQGVVDDVMHDIGAIPKSAHVIHNPFDIAAIQREASSANPTADAHRPYVLCAGHFKRQKRQDLALRAWAQSRIDADIVFIGGGSTRKREALKDLARTLGVSERVHILEWQTGIYQWMAKAELLLVSSDFEGFGRVIVEALAVGTPVVSTDCPSGPREILTGDLQRGLAPVRDATALADRLRELANDPPAITDRHLEPFRLENILDQYEQLPRRS